MNENLAYINIPQKKKEKNYQLHRFREEARNLQINLVEINPLEIKITAVPGQIKLLDINNRCLPECHGVYRKTINNKMAVAIQELLINKGADYLFSEKSKIGRKKLFSYMAFAENGLPFPKTFVLSSKDNLSSCLKFFNYKFPLVIKFSDTTHGVGTMLVESKPALRSIIDFIFKEEVVINQELAIIQEFIQESKGRDIRAIVLNNQLIAAVERDNSQNDFRANVFQGAEVKNIKLTSLQKEVAVKAVGSLGLKFGGVDMMFGKKGPLLTEVNAPCDYSFVEQKTGVNITKTIIKVLIPKT